MLGCGDHGGDEVLKTRSQGEGEVIYRVIWDAGHFVGSPDGAHGLSQEADVKRGGVWLFFATVVVDSERLVVVGPLKAFFFCLEEKVGERK